MRRKTPVIYEHTRLDGFVDPSTGIECGINRTETYRQPETACESTATTGHDEHIL